MKPFLKNWTDRLAAYYKTNKFAVWFFLLSWLFLSLITSQKSHIYILRSDELTSPPIFAYFRGFLTWTLMAWFFPVILKLARLLPIDEKNHYKRNVLLHLVFSICMLFPLTFVYTLISYHIHQSDNTFWMALFANLMWFSMIVPIAYWFVIGGLLLKKNAHLYNKQRQKAVALQSELKEIRLKILQAQLHPHFLFNALNTVSALTFEDSKAAVRILKKIRRYLELSMNETDKPEITLRDELYFTNLYLEIEKVRYSDRLQVEQRIGSGTETALVPNMLLQPLVENAVRHGIAREKGPGKLMVRTSRENGHLRLEVEDSGKGFNTIGIVKKDGLGIKNTMERLHKLYNEDYKFEVVRSSLGGAKVSVLIPYTNPGRINPSHEIK